MTFPEFLRAHGREALFDDWDYTVFEFGSMTLDGVYSLEKLRAIVEFMEREDKDE
jgi:hypothetical protein